MAKKKVLIITGPTASGKSELAVRLASQFGGEIISADSRQVYKGLDIGTGKITKKEMCGIPHHLLDVADPRDQFSVINWLNLTNQAIARIVKNEKLPIVVGGTGFYIDALAGKITLPSVAPNPLLRKRLADKTTEELYKLLKKKDPDRAESIDRHNRVRLIRALEIVETLGYVPARRHSMSTDYSFKYIGLKPEDLETRIHNRLKKRLPGIIRECKKLHNKGLSYKRMSELGLEYRYTAMYLQKKLSRQELREKLYTEIRRYAKRQMTWFKRNKKIQWFNPEKYKDIERYVKVF